MPPIPAPLLPLIQSQISPPATTIIAANPSKHSLVSSTSLNLLSVVSRGSQDPDGNSPGIITSDAPAVIQEHHPSH